MLDRNKTSLSHEVTAAAALYLEERGFKPVETEVSMPWDGETAKGWIADLAGVISPTQTELIELGLLPRPPRYPAWDDPKRAMKIEDYIRPKQAVWHEAYMALLRTMTALVEVKTSRGDFRGDRKWKLQAPTDLAYLVVPRAMIQPAEWPAGWGILDYADGKIRRLRAPTPRSSSIEERFSVVLSIAVRRDHHTRHERWREYAKQERAEEASTRGETRIRKLTEALIAVARGRYGETVEKCLAMHNVRDLPPELIEKITPLWKIMPQ